MYKLPEMINEITLVKTLKNIFFASIICIFLVGCNGKFPGADARKVSADPKERVKKNLEEGRGFRIMGGVNRGGKFDFASSNPLWRATLDVIDFMPLATANYSGGIVITDWYSDNDPNESIKISIRFLSNEIRVDALDIKVFLKSCDNNLNCTVNENEGKLSTELTQSILKKAAKYEKEGIDKNKKKNPYIMSTPG